MRPRRLLLVDADAGILTSLNSLLQRGGRAIRSAHDSGQALAYARETPYDLVVASPGPNPPDGPHLLRRLHAIRPDTKVILLDSADPARIVAAMRLHVYGYFHKPPLPSALSDMVQCALDSTSWRDDVRVVSASPSWIGLEVRCKLDAAERATHFAREIFCGRLPGTACEDVAAAFRELLFNAVEHGGKLNPRKRVRASLVHAGHSLIVHIQDPGRGFSLGRLPHAAISNPDDSPIRHVTIRDEQGQRPGGFGILISRSLVDELAYNQRGNAAMFVKYLK